ncbi:traB domain-containing -like [Chlorella sorokiniana]|uniref:TraB domain-containing-like n=1 Tax=Chlorella sorokiniana TaxID=3076 RepID=A0A2P6TG14_CHLSO|nr:traB domain-containing -like [Chlorella sorokiniana]|eukprot:PRW33045.1 traB domain-containing -like [Chlorella sorokiniana]
MRQLCMEAATAAALPPAEEEALLGTPPGLGSEAAHAELELELLIKELATAATLPPAEEAALLGTAPGLGASALAAEAAPPVIDEASLPQPLAILRCKPEGHPEAAETVFYLLGTAHISEQSCADVARLVRAVRPQFVFLELCKERAAMLAEDVRPRAPTVAEAAALVRAGKATPFSVIYAWLLARVGQGMELVPGGEFRVALQEAKAIGAKYVLGDRPISITMSRVWAALSGWEKARLLGSLLWMGAGKVDRQAMQTEIEHLKQPDALSAAVEQFGNDFPSIVQPLVTERDQYMVYVLRKLALYGDRVVAVVGAGHLKGITEHWEDEIELDKLTRLPGK